MAAAAGSPYMPVVGSTAGAGVATAGPANASVAPAVAETAAMPMNTAAIAVRAAVANRVLEMLLIGCPFLGAAAAAVDLCEKRLEPTPLRILKKTWNGLLGAAECLCGLVAVVGHP